jgi:cell division protein FtsL
MKKYIIWIIVAIIVLALIIAGLLIFFKMTKFQKSGEVVYFEFSG